MIQKHGEGKNRWQVVASPRGDLSVNFFGKASLHPTWQVLLNVNKPMTMARRDYAYRWAIQMFGL